MYNQQPKCINLPILYLKFISSSYLNFKIGKLQLSENINSNFHILHSVKMKGKFFEVML